MNPVSPRENPRFVQSANDEAARSQLAWLLASGLAAEIVHLRSQEHGIVPAPGLEAFVESADSAARDAHDAADRTVLLVRELHTLSGEQPEIQVAIDRAGRAVEAALRAARAAEMAARKVAQLGFGVSAATLGGERIQRLDRAAVAVLFPPSHLGPRVALADDPTVLVAPTLLELPIEVSGLLCRLLCDRRSWVRFDTASGSVGFEVDGGDTLRSTVDPLGVRPDLDSQLQALGWTVTEAGWGASWESPVTISRAGQLAVDTLVGPFGLSSVEGLTVNVGRIPWSG